ncbi:MAG: GNAT family N-acetyltransferase [Flavobacteriales bacterium]|nr:GNAT family N-acetyltransferase [Flavobacteriales bacterium]
MKPKLINQQSGRDDVYSDQRIVDFLHTHLDEYGDPKEDIQRCLDYVHDRGGFALLGIVEDEIIGAVIINETGMSKYIPENILVYIAMDKAFRGKGIGKELMSNAIKLCKGDIALHVESDNPAKFLYEKLGFSNKYLEMRLKR